jgi:hypothetical protein
LGDDGGEQRPHEVRDENTLATRANPELGFTSKKVPEMNGSTSMTMLIIGGAASALGMTMVTASPSAQNDSATLRDVSRPGAA